MTNQCSLTSEAVDHTVHCARGIFPNYDNLCHNKSTIQKPTSSLNRHASSSASNRSSPNILLTAFFLSRLLIVDVVVDISFTLCIYGSVHNAHLISLVESANNKKQSHQQNNFMNLKSTKTS